MPANNVEMILSKIRTAEASPIEDEPEVDEKAGMSAVDSSKDKETPTPPTTNPQGPPQPQKKAGMYQFDNAQKAVEAAKKLGCSGFHKTGDYYMPCESSGALKMAMNKSSDAEKTAWMLDSIEVKAMYEYPDSEVLEKGYSEDTAMFTFRLKHDNGVEADAYYDADGEAVMWVRADVSDLSDYNMGHAANIANVAYAGEVKSVSYDLLEDGQYAYTVEIDGEEHSTDVYVVDTGERYEIAGAKSYEYEEDGTRGNEIKQKSEDEEVEQKADETSEVEGTGDTSEGAGPYATGASDDSSDTKSLEGDVEEKSAAEVALETFKQLKEGIPTE